jgi:predicted transcriptional regulator
MARDRHEIFAQILTSASSAATRTKIMYDTMINFHQVRQFVPMLIEKGLLEQLADKKTFCITEKGRMYLQLYNESAKLLEIDRKNPISPSSEFQPQINLKAR